MLLLILSSPGTIVKTLSHDREIIDVINTKNTSQIFMKDFDFKDLLGNVRYNESGHIIGELRTFCLVLTRVFLSQERECWR